MTDHYTCNATLFTTGTVRTWHPNDQAAEPLFTWVDDKVLDRPTYRTFIRLLDNYESSTGEAEEVTAKEEKENREFINACMNTEV